MAGGRRHGHFACLLQAGGNRLVGLAQVLRPCLPPRHLLAGEYLHVDQARARPIDAAHQDARRPACSFLP
ncbi:MAG: hypothetical protein IT340_08410 [Chloroflexi bacterium]|nr:hypothetical protein [Chloroflexota bacterium]